MSRMSPVVGDWYTDLDTGQLFEVVAFDSRGIFVEVQYVDGEVGEFDLDIWHEMNIATAAAPEDWTSSYEINPEDSGFNDSSAEIIDDPLSTLEPNESLDYDAF